MNFMLPVFGRPQREADNLLWMLVHGAQNPVFMWPSYMDG